jgi:hypothetical protein
MAGNALNSNLFFMGGILVLRFVLRRTWLAIAAGLGIITLIWGPGLPYLGLVSASVSYGLWFFCLFRFGWLPAMLWIFTADILQSYPLTVHLSAWYALPTYLATGVVVGLTLWGFQVSLGGRPAFGDLLAD